MQGSSSQDSHEGRVWLRVIRDGKRIATWGEMPEKGLGMAPHSLKQVDVVVPLADARAGDRLQVMGRAGASARVRTAGVPWRRRVRLHTRVHTLH